MSAYASTTTSIKVVLVLIAMEAEAAPFIDNLKLVEQPAMPLAGPCKSFKGSVGEMTVVVVTNGKCGRYSVDNVGTTPAAVAALTAINAYHPDVVINAGTAGGFHREGGNIGDVYICNAFTHHDRRIPLPGFHDYGRGHHQTMSVAKLIEALKYKAGKITTSNSLDHTEKDDEIMAENAAQVKDMEAASIAWVIENCYTTPTPASPSSSSSGSGTNGDTTVPFFAIKVVTDIVDGSRPTQDEFMENLGKAAASLQTALVAIIGYLQGKTLMDL